VSELTKKLPEEHLNSNSYVTFIKCIVISSSHLCCGLVL